MRIWYLTHRLPYAPNRGDRIRAYHMLQWLQRRAEVTLLSLVHDAEEEQAVAGMAVCADSIHTGMVPRWRNRFSSLAALPTRRPLTLSLLDAPSLRARLRRLRQEQPPDVILAFCSSMAAYAIGPALAGIPLVLDMVDLDSEKWRALAHDGRWYLRPIYAREAQTLRRFEERAVRAARTTLAINEREAQAVRRLVPDAEVVTIGNGIDVDNFAPLTGPDRSAAVVFCGVMDYPPNETAALRLIHQIWPLVHARRPDASLWLVGAGASERLAVAARHGTSIHVTGRVADVRPYLWRSAVAATPLSTARGVQNKVLEALAAGLPVVVSPVVGQGLPASVEPGVTVADSDDDFARVICRLLALSPGERRRTAAAADLRSLTWARQLEPLWSILETAAGRGNHQVA